MKIPEHKASFSISHNDHKDLYVKIEEGIDHIDDDQWTDISEKQKALDNDSLWECRWYPDTPVAFIAVYASTLEAIVEYLKTREDDE